MDQAPRSPANKRKNCSPTRVAFERQGFFYGSLDL